MGAARPRIRFAVAAAIIATAVGAACSGGNDARRDGASINPTEPVTAAAARLPTAVQTLDIDATEYKFGIDPDPARPLRPGWTEVRFRNRGAEPHQVMFARVKDGVDLSELAAAGAGDSSGAGAIEFVDMVGGVSYIGAGQEITAMVDLPEGTVIAMCYVPDEHGVAHALLGMSTFLTVAAPAPASTSTSRPEDAPVDVRGTITMAPDGYEIPASLTPGWYHVVNTDIGAAGTGLHELALLRLERALSAPDLEQLLADIAANAPPDVELEALGGLGAISPGFEGYLYLDLPEGDYVAVDFMPDARDPRPHLLDGYASTFTV